MENTRMMHQILQQEMIPIILVSAQHNLNIFTAIVALFEFEFNRDTQFKSLASTLLSNKN